MELGLSKKEIGLGIDEGTMFVSSCLAGKEGWGFPKNIMAACTKKLHHRN